MSIVNMDAGARSDPFLATVKLLSDPVELEKRHAAFREAEEKAKEAVALVGPASEILAIRKQIEEDLAGAKAALGEARIQASMIVDTARRKAAEIDEECAAKQATADAAIAELHAKEQAALDTANATLADAQRLKAEYGSKLTEVDNLKTQVEHEKEALQTTRIAFEGRLQTLAGIAEQFRGALGAV